MRATSLLALLGYLALARATGDLYPFSRFNMYSTERLASASRILARDQRGAVHELDEYTARDCPTPPNLSPQACPAQWPWLAGTALSRILHRDTPPSLTRDERHTEAAAPIHSPTSHKDPPPSPRPSASG